jgi:hypothetical protein
MNRRRNTEIEQILETVGLTHAQAAEILTTKLGRPMKGYHIGRTIKGERQPAVDEMDALRELLLAQPPQPGPARKVDAPLLTDTGERVPLYRADHAGDNGLRLTEEFRVGVVPVHPAQRGSKSALAFVMNDETLGDRLRLGDIGYAIRGWPPVPGQPCLVERKDLDAVARIYEGRDGSTLFLSQLKPPKQMSMPLRDVAAVHVIVGSAFGPLR